MYLKIVNYLHVQYDLIVVIFELFLVLLQELHQEFSSQLQPEIERKKKR